jgi:predicted PurR-regulated permease PerM
MKEMPITVKRSIELLGLMLLIALFVLGNDIIMPLLMAFFISIMILPVYRFFKKYKTPDVLAIILPILLLLIFMTGMIWFFSAQIAILVADFPQIKENVTIHINSLSNWVSETFNVTTREQTKFIDEQSKKILSSTGNILSGAMGSVSSIFLFFGLLPIYIYLFLFYKNLFLKFIFMWFTDESHPKVKESLKETEVIIKSYLIGLLIQVTYMTILLGGILFIIGIKHALLIGVVFALLNLIPYVGALFGNIIGVLLTLTSSQELSPVITVLIVIAVVQFLDNNILMPRIVGSKVKINALSAILGVIIGGTLAGISGMFLALPIIAVLKIIFDRSDMFKHWGVLLGDERPETSPMGLVKVQVKHHPDPEKTDEVDADAKN